jgi:Kef-type K+ transport system membrane component KefB
MIEGLFSTIEFQMSLLLFMALAGYLLVSRINQSATIGAILIGIVIGPSLLGLITYTDFVRSLAQLGAVILLFVVGLEFKIKEIFNPKYGLVALIGAVLPWLGGYYLAQAFGYEFAVAVFVGTALSATSVAITANVLREMGKLNTEAAKAIIGAAVIDDILGLLALSFSTQIVAGEISLVPIVWTIAKAGLFVSLGAYVGYKYLSRLLEKFDASKFAKKFPETVFIFAIMIAFFYAMFAEIVGVSAIVGAFLAGVALEGVEIKQGKNYKEGAEYLQIIFASVFFVSLGILADLRALNPAVLWFLTALTAVAVITKFVGCYAGARMVKMSHKDSSTIGFGMAPRGEVAMIVALIGLNLGILKQDVYVSLVLMSLLTTVLVPIILRRRKL